MFQALRTGSWEHRNSIMFQNDVRQRQSVTVNIETGCRTAHMCGTWIGNALTAVQETVATIMS